MLYPYHMNVAKIVAILMGILILLLAGAVITGIMDAFPAQ